MAVALDDLAGHRGDFEAQAFTDLLFVFRLKVRAISNCAGELAHAHLVRSHFETSDVALHLRVPVRQLQPKGNGLGMYAVGAPDLRSVLELERTTLKRLAQLRQV